MGYADFLKSLFPDSHDVEAEVYDVVLGAIGYALDQYDPYYQFYSAAIPGVIDVVTNPLSAEFSMTTATGAALDGHGQDLEAPRRNGEDDGSYRQRLLSIIPAYVNGPTVSSVQQVVQQFTGYAPTIFEYGPGAFVIGESAISEAGFSTATDLFAFEVHVQNPGGLSYNHLDLENAVQKAKMARSSAIIYHNGTDTSTAAQASDAVITVI